MTSEKMEGQKDRRIDGRKEGRKDRQTLFYRILLATAKGLITN